MTAGELARRWKRLLAWRDAARAKGLHQLASACERTARRVEADIYRLRDQ